MRAICPHPADLAASKLVAGRGKDRDFVRGLMRHRLVSREQVLAAVEDLPQPEGSRARAALAQLG